MFPGIDTAMVTGASSGIGATYADRLARRGFNVVLVARDVTRLRELANRLSRQMNVRADVLQADLTNRLDIARVEKRLRGDESMKMLVNSAGVGPRGRLLDNDIDHLDRMIALNVTAMNRLAVAAAQAFAARRNGAIINIASIALFRPGAYSGTYSATSAFVLTLTIGLSAELADKGVRVQAVLPGITRTELFARAGYPVSIDNMDQSTVMDAGDMVDAALAGFDQGELVTIPSLPDSKDWDALINAQSALIPNLSHDRPAARYGVKRP
ncbi:SDR family oxidoreductase [Rhizobium sp. BK251]|uniref:SDR family NAD(P)-dependent oxidoreductase n=1 Tax=Rhizobium sp. BK251 TaxID=2512125 RepID=UPI001A9CD0E4|nr:SDR family oxidoreductase [Rhizobium sp. BK251]